MAGWVRKLSLQHVHNIDWKAMLTAGEEFSRRVVNKMMKKESKRREEKLENPSEVYWYPAWLIALNQRIRYNDEAPNRHRPRGPGHAQSWNRCLQKLWLIGGGQMFKFFLDAPPLKPLLWACLLARASRDLYPARLWFARALIPHPICSGRDTGLSRRTNRNLAVISQSEHFFCLHPPSVFVHPSYFIPL